MTAHPFDLDAEAQHLLNLLEGPVSDRWVVLQAARLLDRLSPNQPETEAYLLPLASPLADCLAALDPVGLHPDRLARLRRRLETTRTAHPALENNDALRRAETALARRAALLYGYAGAVEAAVACLDGAASAPDAPPDATPRARLRQAQQAAPTASVREGLAWGLDHWARDDGDLPHATHVPVVEYRPSWARPTAEASVDDPTTPTPRAGALRRVAVELYGPADEGDRLQTDGTVAGADRPDLLSPPLTAARRLLDTQFPSLQGQYVQGRLAVDHRPLQHTGASAGLAVAALFVEALLDHTHQRRRFRVRSSLILTGAVAEDGTTRPVNEATLPLKVQTAFFSPQTRLVVPAAQQAAATTARDDLLDAFPHGRLDVVGVDRLKALFYDRRLTRQRRIGRVRHAAQRLWDRRGAVAGSGLVVALLVIARLLYGPIDQNPTQAQYEGNAMLVQNDAGETIEQIRVGARIVRHVNTKGHRVAAFADVAGDATNELIWEAAVDSADNAKVLRARALGADTLLWERPLQFAAPFPRKPEVVSRTFQVQDLVADDLNGDGATELYVAAEHTTYFPGLVLQLDPQTGTERQRYLHPGHPTTALRHRDLDDDAVQELLLGGYSNAYDGPVLTVLDPRTLQGHGPTTPEYAVSGLSPAEHHAYLRFPESAVQRAAPQHLQVVRDVELDSRPRLVTVEVLDGRTDPTPTPSYLLVHLNDRLRPVAVGSSSGYDRLAQTLVDAGRLDAAPTPGDFARYKQRIRYWTGTGWTPPPSPSGP